MSYDDSKNDLRTNIGLLEAVLEQEGNENLLPQINECFIEPMGLDPISKLDPNSSEATHLAGVLFGLRVALDILEGNE